MGYTLTVHDAETGAIVFQQKGISEETMRTVGELLRQALPIAAAARDVAAAVRSMGEAAAVVRSLGDQAPRRRRGRR
jgi:hypothetical protein